jgi:tetratricopeptide (TPR) repeat protein
LKSAQAALELFEQADDLPAQAVTLMLRSSVYLEMLEFGSAIRCITEAKELYQDVGDKEGEVATLLQLSDVSMKSEDYAGAMKFAQDAQALSDEAGDAKGTASALRLQADIHIIQEDLDSAMRCAEKAMSGFREAEDRVEEVNMVVTLITVRIMILVKKDKEGKTSAKTIKDGVDKVSKLAKDALSTARKEGIKSLTGAAHYALCQVQLLNGEVKKAMASAQEALTIFTEANDERYEANVLTMQANILLAMKDYRLAKEKAEEAIFVFQKVGDAKGEDQAWECVDEVEKIEAEIREAEQARQMAQWQAQQAMAGGGGLTLQPIQQQAAGPDEGAEPSAARGGYEAKLVKMDLASGMDATVIRQQVHEITKGIIGFDEDIEYDMPLMESGLTSNTAVLLRDSLVQQLPGVPLPVTLIFDYPSIQSMTELIVENGEKAAKKAAKLANK